jgi:class 3 adenylate cyclase
VVLALVRIAEATMESIGQAEAALCIGDGYIYVWNEAIGATRFAANLASEIERSVAAGKAPDFHFRMGVHVGPVRWFRDPGRDGWNYTGGGINGGNRVLSAIGKETDDVVFVSGEVRRAIAKDNEKSPLLQALHNRGRRADKHGKPWRVYELNHSARSHW